MNKLPSLLCAAHCVLMPFLIALLGSSKTTHTEHVHEKEVFIIYEFIETIEPVLIVVVCIILIHTICKIRKEKKIALVGIFLLALLICSVILLPHVYAGIAMICIAAYQLWTDRAACAMTHAH